jgi:hypothetical protein
MVGFCWCRWWELRSASVSRLQPLVTCCCWIAFAGSAEVQGWAKNIHNVAHCVSLREGAAWAQQCHVHLRMASGRSDSSLMSVVVSAMHRRLLFPAHFTLRISHTLCMCLTAVVAVCTARWWWRPRCPRSLAVDTPGLAVASKGV